MRYTREQVRRAALILSELVVQQANRMCMETGVHPVQSADAPDTWDKLRLAYTKAQYSSCSGKMLPVSSLHCDRTIYMSPYVNVLFRYWHDMLHCRMDQDFGLAGELTVGAAHCAVAANYFGKDSLEHKLMLADTIGQTVYESVNGFFPADQWEFCFNFVNQ